MRGNRAPTRDWPGVIHDAAFARWRAIPLAILAAIAPATADSIHFNDSRPAVNDVSISLIAGAIVSYAGEDGRNQFASIEEIDHLLFDSLPTLQQAELLRRTDQYVKAIRPFAAALANAESNAQRIWIHARLAQAQDALGHYALATGHSAAVFAMDDNAAWARLVPRSIPDQPGLPAIVEALHHLNHAHQNVTSPELRPLIEQMRGRVEQELRRIAPAGEFDFDAAPTTISGIALDELLNPPTISEPLATTQDPSPRPAADSPKPDPTTMPGIASPEHINSLLDASKFDEAALACEKVCLAPGERDLALFLFQYGRALAGAGRAEDAAMRFMQSAVHFPDSAHAAPALIQTAILYRDHFDKPSIARQLLNQAIKMTQNSGDSDIADRAREGLTTLPAENS